MTQGVPLSEDLLPAVHDFITEMWPVDGARSELHVGDVYATLFFEGTGDLGQSARLWFDRQATLQAVALSAGRTIDMVVRPEVAASSLAADMIAWATAETQRRHPDARVVRVQRRPRLPERVALLQKLGFRRMRNGVVALSRTLDTLPARRALPPGMLWRQVADRDVPARVRAHADAFPEESRSVADYERLVRCRGYDPFLDLVVVAERQAVAAFCTAWFDGVNKVGLFEPVGTCARYRRQGLARAVMSQALHRLKERGATSAVIRTRSENAAAIACYRNLGFEIVSDLFGFEKPIDR